MELKSCVTCVFLSLVLCANLPLEVSLSFIFSPKDWNLLLSSAACHPDSQIFHLVLRKEGKLTFIRFRGLGDWKLSCHDDTLP